MTLRPARLLLQLIGLLVLVPVVILVTLRMGKPTQAWREQIQDSVQTKFARLKNNPA